MLDGKDRKAAAIMATLSSLPKSSHIPTTPAQDSGTSKTRSKGGKRAFKEAFTSLEDDTDSEIELFPTKGKRIDKAVKRQKTTRSASDQQNKSGNGRSGSGKSVQISQPDMKRLDRILDPTKPEHKSLIDKAAKAGAEYYDSDADDLPGDIKGVSKSHLFRNVVWGPYASDMSKDADFPTHPKFTQFVPGRFERLPDGTVSDQKAKLVIKLTDSKGKKHVYKNPPPRNWNNQEAITALNKRTVQQIRRTTEVQFRARVPEYIEVERRWILANLTVGKPTNGWKNLVDGFNQKFAGKVVEGDSAPRPARTHSSLTREISRFSAQYYSQGCVPVLTKSVKKEKNKA